MDTNGVGEMQQDEEKAYRLGQQADGRSDLQKDNAEADDSDKQPPDGGLEAWLVATGGFAVFFCTLGFANSFGVFQEYYMTHQLKGMSPDDVSWIGSIATFLQFAMSVVAGPLFDRYGKWVMRPASVLYAVSIMLLSICRLYWHFMLAQGILMGSTMAFLQIPAMGAVSQFFDKKRAAALGVVISGSSVGGVVLPIALSRMLNSTSLGYGWSVRIVGFIMLPLMFFACVSVKSRVPPRKSGLVIMSAFKNTQFLVLTAALFTMMLGIFMPLFYLPSYAVSKGVDPTMASYLLAILNAASTFGRIIPGILADKYGRMNLFALAGFASGIVLLCLTSAKSTPGLIVYAVFIGFSTGTVISGGAAAITSCLTNHQEMGSYIGMAMTLASFATLTGPPVNGSLADNYGYESSAIFSGVVAIVGGLVVVVAKTLSPSGLLSKA